MCGLLYLLLTNNWAKLIFECGQNNMKFLFQAF